MTQRIFFGHHKCASSWMSRIFYSIQKRTGLTISYGASSDMELVIVPNASFDWLEKVSTDYKGIHLVRDPRDVIISGYFSHRNTHRIRDWENLAKHRKVLQEVDFNEGLFLEMEFSTYFLMEHMYRWNYQNPKVLELKFEEVTKLDYDFTEIFQFLDLHTPEKTLNTKKYLNKLNNKNLWVGRYSNIGLNGTEITEIIEENSFKKLSKGRKQGAEDTTNHYRKGISGEWKTCFTDEHVAHFKEKFGGLVEKLGYTWG